MGGSFSSRMRRSILLMHSVMASFSCTACFSSRSVFNITWNHGQIPSDDTVFSFKHLLNSISCNVLHRSPSVIPCATILPLTGHKKSPCQDTCKLLVLLLQFISQDDSPIISYGIKQIPHQ